MTPAEIAASYDRLAAHWDGEAFPRENGIEAHRRAMRFQTTRGRALDAGCGSSGRIIDLMLAEGYTPEGLDLSPGMLARARRRHPEVVFHGADLVSWEPPHRYDLISAWDSLWHAPLAAQEAILAKLCGSLERGGILIFTSGGVDHPEEKTDPCMGEPMYHAAPGIPKLLEIIAAEGCICRHLEYDQFPEEHLCVIVQRREE